MQLKNAEIETYVKSSSINYIDSSVINITNFTIAGGVSPYSNLTVPISLSTNGAPTHYRIGETSDLSSVAWVAYSSSISYTFSSYGTKTLYAQVKNATSTSPTASSSIVLQEVSSGEIKMYLGFNNPNTAAGYGMNKPVTYYDKTDDNYKVTSKKNIFYGTTDETVTKINAKEQNSYVDKIIDINNANDEQSINIHLMKDLLIQGVAYEMDYTDENGDIQIAVIDDDCMPIYNRAVKPLMIGFIRKLIYYDPLNTDKARIVYEKYTHKDRLGYNEDGTIYTLYDDTKAKPFQDNYEIPFIEYEMDGQISYIEQLISQIRGYELVTNNTKKVMNYNDDALLMVRGYHFDDGKTEKDVDDAIRLFHTKGTLFLDQDDSADAKWLIKDVNDTTTQNHKKNLANDIFNEAGTFNPSSDNQVYQNTLSLMFKLYGLETKMGDIISDFKRCLYRRLKIITDILNYVDKTDYNYRNINMTFSRDLPSNTNEEINLANQLKDLLPLQQIYEMLSFVENPKKTVQQWKSWQLELAKIDAQKENIMSEMTKDNGTMVPDRIKNNGSNSNAQDEQNIDDNSVNDGTSNG